MEIIVSRYLKTLEQAALELAGESKRAGRYTILLVPSQASFLMEKQIIAKYGGFCDIEVMSFEKLTHSILDRTGGRTLPRTDITGVSIRIRRILAESADELKLFDPKRDDELHMRLASSIASIESEDIGPDELRALAQQAEGQLSDKLYDLALVMERLSGELSDELTPAMVERYAAQLIPQSDFLKDARVIIHGFELLTAGRLNMITMLLTAGCDVSVLLEADKDDDVFYHQNMLALRLENAARIAGKSTKYRTLKNNAADMSRDIAFLEDALYSFPMRKSPFPAENIEIVCANSEQAQADVIVSRILEENAAGMRLRDIGILCPSQPPMRLCEALTGAGISYSARQKRPLSRHRLCDFVLYAVKLVYNGRWATADVEAFLKTRMLLDTRETDALLKYAAQHGFKGYRYKDAWEDEEAESLRSRAVAPVMIVAGQKDAAQACLKLREFILSSDIPDRLEAEAAMLERCSRAEEARFTSQAAEKVCDILMQTAACAQGMDNKQLYALLKCAFNTAQVAIVPPGADEIVLGDISHSIISRKKLMIICDAEDTTLPAPPAQGLFTVDELCGLNEKLFFPGLSLAEDQRIYIRRAVSGADKLMITYDERKGLPSTVIERILRIFNGLDVKKSQDIPLCSADAVERAAAGELRATLDGADMPLKNASAVLQSGGGDILAALEFENRPTRLSEKTAREIYGAQLKSSVSRIEEFMSCPYRHFINYGLRPQNVTLLEEDSRMTGSYVHELLDGINRALKADHMRWDEASDEKLHELTQNCAKRLRETHNSGYFKTDKRAQRIGRRLDEEVEYTAKAIRDHFKGSHAYVDKSELKFGGNGELTIDTDAGSIDIRGVVDRVDIAVAEDGTRFLRIVDYKSGDKKYRLSEVFYGISIQLIVYLMAAMKIYEGCIPAGGFYFHIDMPFSKYTDDERFMDMRMNGFLVDDKKTVLLFDDTKNGKLISMEKSFLKDGSVRGGITADDIDMLMKYTRRLIAQAVHAIFSGEDDISPYYESAEKNACAYCDYRAICRYDESFSANKARIMSKKSMDDINAAEREEQDETDR